MHVPIPTIVWMLGLRSGHFGMAKFRRWTQCSTKLFVVFSFAFWWKRNKKLSPADWHRTMDSIAFLHTCRLLTRVCLYNRCAIFRCTNSNNNFFCTLNPHYLSVVRYSCTYCNCSDVTLISVFKKSFFHFFFAEIEKLHQVEKAHRRHLNSVYWLLLFYFCRIKRNRWTMWPFSQHETQSRRTKWQNEILSVIL